MKRLTLLILLAAVLLSACGAPVPGSASSGQPAPGESASQSGPQTPPDSDNSPAGDGEWQTVTIGGEEMEWNGYVVKEPEGDLDIQSMSFSDFGDGLFEQEYPVTVDSYLLTPGEITEAEVYHIKGQEEGPTVYIVAGVHGDERAAWYTGMLLRNVTLARGDLYVLAPANTNGAKDFRRYVTGKQDLNRSFPGDPEGNEAQRIAHAIFEDIREKQPVFLFDLHEAIVYTAGRDFLGSTLIFTKLEGMEDLFFDLMLATQQGELCSNPFGYTGPGPSGSLNSTATNQLSIPTITVETFRGFDVHRRVGDQLAIVQYTLEYLGLR